MRPFTFCLGPDVGSHFCIFLVFLCSFTLKAMDREAAPSGEAGDTCQATSARADEEFPTEGTGARIAFELREGKARYAYTLGVAGEHAEVSIQDIQAFSAPMFVIAHAQFRCLRSALVEMEDPEAYKVRWVTTDDKAPPLSVLKESAYS